MKHKTIIFLMCGMTLLFLSSCWDQRLLREHSLALSIGYDQGENGGILKTITYPSHSSGSDQAEAQKNSKVLTTEGNTVKDAEKKMDQQIPERFDRSNARAILFGKELAEEGIFSSLDSVYRDLRGPLNAKVAIFDGKAKEALSVNTDESFLTGDLYAELLESAEKAGITWNKNVQTACPILLADGKDLVLPYLSINENKEVRVEGLALFHEDQMTGTLDTKETTMFLILSDQVTKNSALNLKVTDDKEEHVKNFANVAIRHNKQSIKVHVEESNIQVAVNVQLNVEIDEFASDNLQNDKKMRTLETQIEKALSELAEKTLQRMQEANNDSLGVGERLRAYHHDTWESINWEDMYPTIDISSTFKVDIVRHGIIN